jgi:putative colanic acid biosynthesis UDP-glucose lipid carrier transferase
LLFAETIQLYRYWSKKGMVQLIYTVISALIAIACVTTFLFFNKSGQEVSRVAIGLWFVITSLGGTTWQGKRIINATKQFK